MMGLQVVHVFEHGVKKELIFLFFLFIVMVCIIKDLKRPRASQCLHSLRFTKHTYCMFCNLLFYLLVNLIRNRLPMFVVRM